MKRNTRMIIYSVLIVLGLFAVRFDAAPRFVDWLAVNRFEDLMQYRKQEYKSFWMGVPVLQFPNDLMSYANLIQSLKPDVIIETGTAYGGLALFLASELYHVNPEGVVISVDISSDAWKETLKNNNLPQYLLQRIHFVEGDSKSDTTLGKVRELLKGRKALVILDSLHTAPHVLAELEGYSQFVNLGGYIVVNDTQHERLGMLEKGNGPLTAVKTFLSRGDQFQVDEQLPHYLISCARSGFLKKVL